tara:strand:- start:38 stop:352 length:315 start_codon:yes stop_codon:yes gene_type:complete
MNYENPWADHPSFIDLGTFNTYESREGKLVEKNHDLYILWNPEKESIYDVDFGIRLSNEGSDYWSYSLHTMYSFLGDKDPHGKVKRALFERFHGYLDQLLPHWK